MRHPAHTTRERDRRLTRVRRVTQSILLGSGLATGAFVAYAAATARPLPHAASPTTTTTAPRTSGSSASTYAPPTAAPVTTTTTCSTTPSGSTVCY